MMMQPYEKMKTHVSHRVVRKVSPKDKFCLLEKIHGANFCMKVVAKDCTVFCCRRRAVIGADETFFGYKDVEEKYAGPAKDLLKLIQREQEMKGMNIEELHIFGELCGGNETKFGPVQHGVFYCNHLEFAVFDVAVTVVTSGEVKRLYLPYDRDLIERIESTGLLCIKPLTVCSLTEALDFPIDFQSTFWKRFSSGAPPPRFNLAEGIVVKHISATPMVGEERLIFKRKNDVFQEKAYDRPKPQQDGEEKMSPQERAALCLINRPRLESAASKHGKLSPSLAKPILQEMVTDILQDLDEIDPAQLPSLRKLIVRECKSFMENEYALLIQRNEKSI